MNKISLILSTLAILIIIIGTIAYAMTQGVDVLDPAGAVSLLQRNLFVVAVGLGLIAFVPVLIMTLLIVLRYRSTNNKSESRFDQSFDVKPMAAWIWGGFVVLIITTLTVIMFKSTYAIDPYLSIDGAHEPISVQVVALPWKWLFIYPDEQIATVNELVVPEDTPIKFELTADAPMSSFWIPKLGGMIYAMEGMVTQLNLIANETGQFEGMNTEINGKGYANMRFAVRSVSDADYVAWQDEVRLSDNYLDMTAYAELAKPTVDHPVQHYAYSDPALFGTILMKFMHQQQGHSHTSESSPTPMEHHGAH